MLNPKELKQYSLQEILKQRIDELAEDKLWELYAITNRYKVEAEAQFLAYIDLLKEV